MYHDPARHKENKRSYQYMTYAPTYVTKCSTISNNSIPLQHLDKIYMIYIQRVTATYVVRHNCLGCYVPWAIRNRMGFVL